MTHRDIVEISVAGPENAAAETRPGLPASDALRGGTRPGVFAGLWSAGTGFARRFGRLPSLVLLGFIAVYQRAVSPVLPIVTLGGCACRFSPTCSQYAADAIRRHGSLAGTWLAVRRVVKCTPLHPGGFDPVPARHARRPQTSEVRQTHLG